jgi:septal ring factor EnvC (AmiA/AmiB activator)
MSRDQDKVEQENPDWARKQAGTVLAAESLRSGASPAEAAPPAPRADDKISAFWRIFGGTVLSVVTLIILTAFQQLSGSLSDMRSKIDQLTENNAKLVGKEEFSNRMSRFWDNVKGTTAEVPALKAQVAAQEALLREAEKERKELCKEVQALRERLAGLEAHHAAGKSSASGKDAPADK